MAKQLTNSKIRSLIKEIEKLLNQRTNDKILIELLINKIENVITDSMNEFTVSEEQNVTTPEQPRGLETKGFIASTHPKGFSDEVKANLAKGSFVLRQSDSEKYDERRNRSA